MNWFNELYRIIKLISYGGTSKKLTAQFISALDETLSPSLNAAQVWADPYINDTPWSDNGRLRVSEIVAGTLYISFQIKFGQDELDFPTSAEPFYLESVPNASDIFFLTPDLSGNQWSFATEGITPPYTITPGVWYSIAFAIILDTTFFAEIGMANGSFQASNTHQGPTIGDIRFGAIDPSPGVVHRNLKDLYIRIGRSDFGVDDVFVMPSLIDIVPTFDSQSGDGISIDTDGSLLISNAGSSAFVVKNFSYPPP